MRNARIVTSLVPLVVGLLAGCGSKKSSDGLPPATEWGSATASDKLVPMPGMKPANPHDNMPPGHPPIADMGGSADEPDGSDMGNHPPVVMADKTAAKTLEKLPDGRLALGPFALAAPADWTQKPITSSMRAAAFQLAAKPGEEAELVVYYFGPDGAGSVEDNLDRWLGQFTQADGKPSKDVAKIEKTKILNQDATIVSVSGHFAAMAMPGASDAVDKADQSLLAAIIGSPSGPYYLKLVGAKKTVEANTAKFRAMLTTLKLK